MTNNEITNQDPLRNREPNWLERIRLELSRRSPDEAVDKNLYRELCEYLADTGHQPADRPLCVNCFKRPSQNRCKECEEGIREFFSGGTSRQPTDAQLQEVVEAMHSHWGDTPGGNDVYKQCVIKLYPIITRQLINSPTTIDPDHLATILVKSIMEIRWPCTLDDMPKAIAFVSERLIHAYAIRGVSEEVLGPDELRVDNKRLKKQVADLQSRLDVVRHFNQKPETEEVG